MAVAAIVLLVRRGKFPPSDPGVLLHRRVLSAERKSTKLLVVVAMVLSVVAACSGDRPTFVSGEDLTPSTSSDVPVEAAPETTTTSEAAPPQPTLGLITPTGITVAVLDAFRGEYQVTTPCGNEEIIPGGIPLNPVEIVLDPGHGGNEVGSVGSNNLAESDLNLALAELTAEKLQTAGYTVALTRTGDYRVPLANRVVFAEHMGAEILVSIHHNGPNASSSDTPGTEVFVPQNSPEAMRLGGLLHQAVFEALDVYDLDWSSARDAGVFSVINGEGEDSYGIVRLPTIPVALIEMGYLSNTPEADFYATDEYLDVSSDALVDAIERWNADPLSSGTPLTEPRYFSPRGTGGAAGCEDPALS